MGSAPSGQAKPAGQAVGCESGDRHLNPEGHGSHEDAPIANWYSLPVRHAVGAGEPAGHLNPF